MDRIDLIRGIWNLFFNLKAKYRVSSGRAKPVNNILLGPIHTLHYPDGGAATTNYWYDVGYCGPQNLFDIRKDKKQLSKFESKIRDMLKKHYYKKTISELVIRYCRALDDPNLSSCFLGLWSVLEGLTASGNDRYDVTIRRAAFIWEDPNYHKQILQNLRMYRNIHVHLGSHSDRVESYVFQLKNYVEQLLLFHIGNKLGFRDLKETSQFLDLPFDSSDVKNKRKMLDKAWKFRN